MSTKSKARSERRAKANDPNARLSERERMIAGELMGAILVAFSFGALEA
jgi:hypothetical protein